MHRNPHSQIIASGNAAGVGLSLRAGLMYEDYPPMGYNTFRK